MHMKRLLTILCLPAVLLLSSTEGWSLPPCEGSYNATTWTNCFGTFNFISMKYGKHPLQTSGGGKYVDEEATAKTSRSGMWAGEFVEPWEWRRK